MPFPWKKARVTRISRLVADLQSPKHGGSLVVETGFPTSLIDLFVKNRDRLKKPSSKKKKRLEISDPVTLSAPPLDIRLNSSDSDGFWGSAISRIENLGCRNCEEEVHDIDAGGLVDDQRVVEEGGVGGPKASRVFVAILKMFIVVVLALGTKKLAVGITMSAFVLLFLEYVGKRVVWFLKPCSDMQMALRSLIQRVLPCVWREQRVLKLDENRGLKALIRQDEIVDSESCGLIEDLKSNDPIEEIELDLVAPVEEIQTLKPDFVMLSRDRRWGYEEIDPKKRVVEEDEEGGEVLEQRNRRTRSAKLKAKILKKFVPKKFRCSKKGKTSKEEPESSSESSSYMGEDKRGRCEEQEQREDGEGQKPEVEEDESSISPSEQERCEEREVIDDGISSSGELSKVVTGTGIVSKKVGRETEGNSGYLIIVLIVLAGLVGGRVVALFLIIAWCFMLKSVGTFRRFTKVPMIRSPV